MLIRKSKHLEAVNELQHQHYVAEKHQREEYDRREELLRERYEAQIAELQYHLERTFNKLLERTLPEAHVRPDTAPVPTTTFFDPITGFIDDEPLPYEIEEDEELVTQDTLRDLE